MTNQPKRDLIADPCPGCGATKHRGYGHVLRPDKGKRGKKRWCVGKGFEGLYVAN